MKKILLGALPFFCMLVIITFISKAKPIQHLKEHSVTVQHGLLTLPAHTDTDIFSINGQWHFTPNQFYYFSDATRPLYGPFPGRLSETVMQTDYGYASYGLRIVGLNPDKVYALQLNHILSSCTIVINGIDRAGQGQPGISAQTEIPGKTISIATFKPLKNGTADVIINMSNFHNRYGGTDQSITLGSAEMLNQSFVLNILFYNICCTVLVLLSIFFIVFDLNCPIYYGLHLLLSRLVSELAYSIRIFLRISGRQFHGSYILFYAILQCRLHPYFLRYLLRRCLTFGINIFIGALLVYALYQLLLSPVFQRLLYPVIYIYSKPLYLLQLSITR